MSKIKETLLENPDLIGFDETKARNFALLSVLDDLAHNLVILTDLIEEVVLGSVEKSSEV